MVAAMERVTPIEICSTDQGVIQSIRRRLRACSFAFVFCRVTAEYDDGRLTLRGSVPSFYLKQVLQELLRGIEHVTKIDNDVDVVSSHGLSSVRPNLG